MTDSDNTNKNEETLVLSAKKDFLFDDFESAQKKFDSAISQFPNSQSKNTYILYLSICKYKLSKYEDALKELDILEKDENYKKDFTYFLTRGKILFYLDKFVDCKMTLNNALHLISSTDKESLNLLTPWLNKVDVELKEGGVIDYNVTNVGQLKIIYNWIQTATNITVDITSNHNLNVYEIKLSKKLIEFIDKKSNEVKYKINLTNGIIPEKSTSKITSSMKCKLELVKEVENFNWVNLEVNNNDDSLNNPKDKVVHGYYPSSSKVKKDWSQLDKEIDEQEKEDATKDGNEGMWRLFRDIYAKGNEETRRAMIKSFQTSGGTVLSTNWNEVKDKDYEGKDRPEAPKGQEWATPPKK